MSLTENHACGAIMDSDRIRRNFCLPRFTPMGWWECDVFELTKTDRFREYEVKTSLADFKNDAKKDKQVSGSGHYGPDNRWTCKMENKHELLAKGDPRGPSSFWFVTPVDLLPITMLPAWAGLIELVDRGPKWSASSRWQISEKVKAPKLHDTPAPQHRKQMLGCCYYRFHDLLRALNNRSEIPNAWTDDPPPGPEVVENA